jgi:hypothetical protein
VDVEQNRRPEPQILSRDLAEGIVLSTLYQKFRMERGMHVRLTITAGRMTSNGFLPMEETRTLPDKAALMTKYCLGGYFHFLLGVDVLPGANPNDTQTRADFYAELIERLEYKLRSLPDKASATGTVEEVLVNSRSALECTITTIKSMYLVEELVELEKLMELEDTRGESDV